MDPLGLTLRQLDAQFIGMPYYNERGNVIYPHVDTIEEAKGIRYLCPVCFAANGGSVGTHGIVNMTPVVGQEFRPTPGRWDFVGTGLDDLSLVAGSSSIAITGGCNAHYWITNGRIADGKLE